MTVPKPLTLATRRTGLTDRLASLTTRLQAIHAELESHRDRDWEEMALAREGDEVLEAEGLAGQQEIRRIEAALARVDAGDYGNCTRCGATISKERLDVLPYTPMCPVCATATEKGL